MNEPSKCCRCSKFVGKTWGMDLAGNVYCRRRLCEFKEWLRKRNISTVDKTLLVGMISGSSITVACVLVLHAFGVA